MHQVFFLFVFTEWLVLKGISGFPKLPDLSSKCKSQGTTSFSALPVEAFTGLIPSARKHLHGIPIYVNSCGEPNMYIALPLYTVLLFPLPEPYSLHFLSALHRISKFSVTCVLLGHGQV